MINYGYYCHRLFLEPGTYAVECICVIYEDQYANGGYDNHDKESCIFRNQIRR